MSSAGPNSPGTITSTGSGIAWSSAKNAGASDNNYASVLVVDFASNTRLLKATNFNFAIPTGATIDGISVSIERKASKNSATEYVIDYSLKLVKTDVVSGDSLADTTTKWPTSDTVATYGGAANLWGNSLTAEDVNDSTFGVALQARLTPALESEITAYVDHITITVTYTLAASGNPWYAYAQQ